MDKDVLIQSIIQKKVYIKPHLTLNMEELAIP